MSKVPLFRAITIRKLSSQAVPVSGSSCYEVKNTTLPNKLHVASVENDASISRVSIIFKAGSRNESFDNAGVTHALRICAGISTKNASQFAITRNIQQVGANLTVTSDRETIAYTLEGTRPALAKVLPFLSEVATQQIFKPWEVSDNVPRMRLELATRPPQLRAVDLLHKAAYRTGLGNSIYSAKYNLGKHSPETLQHYVGCNFQTGRAAVVGFGVDHGQLVDYARSLDVKCGDGKDDPSPYKGGEIRSDKGGDMAYVAIGAEGCSLANPQEVLACSVLQRALGVGPQTKWGFADNGLLSKSVGVAPNSAISALNASYTDSGLFGVLIAAPARDAGRILDIVLKVLKSRKISDEDLCRGKSKLTTAILLAGESGTKTIGKLARQAVLTGTAESPAATAAAVDTVSEPDVNAVLEKIAMSKLTMASVGNLACVPFIDQLK